MLQPRFLLVLAALLVSFASVVMKDGATILPGGSHTNGVVRAFGGGNDATPKAVDRSR